MEDSTEDSTHHFLHPARIFNSLRSREWKKERNSRVHGIVRLTINHPSSIYSIFTDDNLNDLCKKRDKKKEGKIRGFGPSYRTNRQEKQKEMDRSHRSRTFLLPVFPTVCLSYTVQYSTVQ